MTSMLSRLAAAATLSFAMLLAGPAAAAGPVAGVDYVEIADGAPFGSAPGQIEVVEVFGYTCSHCASFEPKLAAWKARLPADVSFVAVPAPFGGYWLPYARAYYAAQAHGLVERTHADMFRALHEQQRLPIMNATPAEIAGFYAGYGADPQAFAATMTGAEVDAKLELARGFIRRSGVEGTPSLIVAGRYKVLGTSFEELLDTADALIARERAAGAAVAHN
ncbi:thiol:disulfide interchange protein DsbA/DsbL [Novilysobacter arseniciresistens]|uniref:thiol:disulfide interchange protein DsbA/DsbL n=1 Tax=Novilysobacter arseniciresistens TaxID=1385522 RepID=UPI00068EFFB1|nr:thiol:disulfide interchange protein DsbA/DsbL [Lysobacter arseniciresistens]